MVAIHELLKSAHQQLKPITANPWREAEDLLCCALGKTRNEILLVDPCQEIPLPVTTQFTKYLSLRVQGTPLPYVLGFQNFYGLAFAVNPAVLIPRPETEVLVQEALRLVESFRTTSVTIADIGTGSGCIAISVAHALPTVPTLSITAIDISGEALGIALRNAKTHQVHDRITFVQGDLTIPLREKPQVILANLPYLPTDMVCANALLVQEPKAALDGGQDGLGVYRRLFNQIGARAWNTLHMIVEIDPIQEKSIMGELKARWPQCYVEFVKDMHGLTRVARVAL